MKKRILICISVVALLLLSLVAGCSPKGGKEKNPLTTIKLCEVTHSIFYAPQYVAIAQGFFEEENIKIELSNGGGADKVMSAVISNSVDIGLAGPEASVYVYNSGSEDYPEVFAQLTACDGSFLVGRSPNPDFKWSDIKGAHVLPGRIGGMPYMAFRYALEKNGINPDQDAKMDTTIQFDMMTGAFLGGTGDYVTMFEPVASSVQLEGKGYIVASVGAAAGEMPYTAYFAKKSYIAKNSDLVQRFTNAIVKGQQWVATHSSAEIADCVKSFFADTDVSLLTSAVESYKKIGALATTPVMTEEGFNRLQEVIQKAGELDKPAPFDKLINNTFANKATGK